MPAVQLVTMRDEARKRAKMEDSAFAPDADVDALINAEGAELWDILISRPTNPFTTSVEFTIASGNTQAVPDELFSLRALDFKFGSEWIEVRRSTFAERNRSAVRGRSRERYFDIIGPTIYITPAEAALGTYRLWYDPAWVPLVGDSDTVTLPNGWEEYIICGAAAQLLAEEESDPSFWEARKAKAEQRILAMTTERDKGAPRGIVDVRGGCWGRDEYEDDT